MLLPTHGHYVQEDLHFDGSSILDNGGTPPTGRYGTRGHTDDKMEQHHQIGKLHRHGEGSFDREGTLRQIYQSVRELQNEALNSSSIARSSATMPGHTGRKSRPADIVQEDIIPTNARTPNN